MLVVPYVICSAIIALSPFMVAMWYLLARRRWSKGKVVLVFTIIFTIVLLMMDIQKGTSVVGFMGMALTGWIGPAVIWFILASIVEWFIGRGARRHANVPDDTLTTNQ